MAAGRPKFKITKKVLKQVETLSANGLNLNEIAGVLGIHIDTFIKKRKEYSELKGTTLIGTIQKEDEKDEDSLLEVVYG